MQNEAFFHFILYSIFSEAFVRRYVPLVIVNTLRAGDADLRF